MPWPTIRLIRLLTEGLEPESINIYAVFTIVFSLSYINVIKTETSHISIRKIMTVRWISRVSKKFHLLDIICRNVDVEM